MKDNPQKMTAHNAGQHKSVLSFSIVPFLSQMRKIFWNISSLNPSDEKTLLFFEDVVEYRWVWLSDRLKRTSKAGG